MADDPDLNDLQAQIDRLWNWVAALVFVAFLGFAIACLVIPVRP